MNMTNNVTTLLSLKAAKTLVKPVRPKSLRAVLMAPVMFAEVRKGNIQITPEGQVMGDRKSTILFAQTAGYEVEA
ncbi:hypothetical protein PS874_00005 [Pseudomonas fluorescens]|nr:hypothetical protein PS874_00005 [Pseudomonas fluorescens]